jgi:uncharacterized protein (TIGR03085 family)
MRSVLRVHDYEDVLSRLEAGPPFPLSLADELINLHEYYIHHEDIRRCNGRGPRALPAEMEQLMWARLRRMLRFSYRNVKGVRLEIVPTNGDPAVVGKAGEEVTLTGPLGEIFLFSFNRKELAQVELRGDDAGVERVRAARLGV